MEKLFRKAIREAGLKKNHRVLVALSGGKDSGALLYLMKKFDFNVEGIYVDLCVGGYSKNCLEVVEKLCSDLNVELNVYNLKKEQGKSMKDIWKKTKKQGLNNCSACGVMKKWVLNKKARELGFDFIATGHNLDDEVQTFLINVFKGTPQLSANSGVVTQNKKDKKFIDRVKPLFYVPEKDVLAYAKKNKIRFIEGKCPYAEDSYRIEVREWIEMNLSRKEKENILKNFEMVRGKIEKIKDVQMNYCGICGEPSRGKICKKCSFE